MTLTWEAPDALTVAGYTILRKVLGEAETSVHVEDTGSVEARYVDSVAVEAGTTYVYRVMAIGAGGAGAQSDPVEIATGDAVKETTSWR